MAETMIESEVAVPVGWQASRGGEHAAMARTTEVPPPPENDREPAGELIREAFDATRDLVRLEVALAREEIKTEVAQAKAGGIALGIGATAALLGVTMCLVAVAAAFSILWLAALIIGGIFLIFAATAGLSGWRALPKHPMDETRERLESDVKQLKERAAS